MGTHSHSQPTAQRILRAMNFTPPPPQMHHGWPPTGAPEELVDFYRDKAQAMNRANADNEQQQQQQQALPPPQQQHAPLEFHVYKDPRVFGQDDVVTGPDKQMVLFHLVFPVKLFSGRWDLSLHRGGPTGPEICRLVKGHFNDSFDIAFANGPVVRCQRTGTFSTKYEFQGAGGTAWYCWKSDGHFFSQNQYTLYRSDDLKGPKENRRALAHWRTP